MFFKRILDGRKVRVFVTYSVDSKKHMKAVMSICKCLKENEFSVSLDAREAALLAHDRIGWYEERLASVGSSILLLPPTNQFCLFNIIYCKLCMMESWIYVIK